MSFDPHNIRNDFPILQAGQDKPLVYLDNAATTLKPQPVINAVTEYYSHFSANVHRGVYDIGEKATAAYEGAREKMRQFINAPSIRNIIFTQGTTESINLVAYSWARRNLKQGDVILITEMEHHSNLVPWQLVARDTGAVLRYLPLLADGTLDISEPDQYFTSNLKLLAVTHQSNVLGTVNPLSNLIEMAHSAGALVLVDAAQSIPHFPVDVTLLNCDFLMFSGHKMIGPTGVGVLYGREDLLDQMDPFISGGEMITTVNMAEAQWNELPWKFEAGTPNIAQVIGLGAAVDYLNKLGLDAIHKYELDLTQYTLEQLTQVEGLQVLGPRQNRGPVFSFSLKDIHPHDVAQLLNEFGVAVRAGHHCAEPISRYYHLPATTRASLYFYNTRAEIDLLVDGLNKVLAFWKGEVS